MLQEVKVPKRGMTNTPILVAEWGVKEGESVEQGSEVVTLEEEKITYTIEAEISGTHCTKIQRTKVFSG